MERGGCDIRGAGEDIDTATTPRSPVIPEGAFRRGSGIPPASRGRGSGCSGNPKQSRKRDRHRYELYIEIDYAARRCVRADYMQLPIEVDAAENYSPSNNKDRNPKWPYIDEYDELRKSKEGLPRQKSQSGRRGNGYIEPSLSL